MALRRREEEGRERAETVNRAHLKTVVSEKRRELSCGGTMGGIEEAHETSPAALRRKNRLKARAIIEVAP